MNRLLLVDTGVVFSVLPVSSKEPATDPAIMSASGQPIQCWGWQEVTLVFSGRRFCWKLLWADVDFPLLGADFLQHFSLSVHLDKFFVQDAAGHKFNLIQPPAGSAFALLGFMLAAESARSAQAPSHGGGSAPSQQQQSGTGSTPSALHLQLNRCSTALAVQQQLDAAAGAGGSPAQAPSFSSCWHVSQRC
jgi:hypothetical protein